MLECQESNNTGALDRALGLPNKMERLCRYSRVRFHGLFVPNITFLHGYIENLQGMEFTGAAIESCIGQAPDRHPNLEFLYFIL